MAHKKDFNDPKKPKTKIVDFVEVTVDPRGRDLFTSKKSHKESGANDY